MLLTAFESRPQIHPTEARHHRNIGQCTGQGHVPLDFCNSIQHDSAFRSPASKSCTRPHFLNPNTSPTGRIVFWKFAAIAA
jgi:hypothetical protein